MTQKVKAAITIGPILFHWQPEKWRDFYYRMADEAPVDTVYIGEAVCSKRAPFYDPMYEDVAERLEKSGKKVVFSTLSEVTVTLDRRLVSSVCSLEKWPVEVNDASALWHLSGREHVIGPFMNVYNEDTLSFLSSKGAKHFCLPSELPAESISLLGAKARELNITMEIQVYGRIPLALSARCYHARALGRTKDACLFACEQDPDGMPLKTLTGKPFLAINGIQTLSHTCLNLAQELPELIQMGINSFRLSPHTHDMAKTSSLFRDILDGRMEPDAAINEMEGLARMTFSNGFYHKVEGFRWIQKRKQVA